MDKNYNEENEKELRRSKNRKHMKQTDKKKTSKKKKVFKRIMGVLLILFIIAVIAVVGMLFGIIGGTERLTKEDLVFSNLTTIIYDKDGNEYATVHGGENRVIAKLTDMSPYLPKAFIAIEDERFEKHFGVDVKRTGAAIFKYIFNGGNSGFGGSTITQQLVKNITGDKKNDPIRKVREWIRAVQVETWLTKEEIMEMYLNIIYLGDGAYGVQTASYNYFGKDVKELTIAECAVLAAITHGPEGYDQYKAPEKIKARQEIVLGKMLELGSITKEQYDEAMAQELVYKREVVSNSSSYITEAVIDDVIKDIQTEKKTTKAVATKMVYGDGLKIYTNIDSDVQKAMEKVYNDEKYFPLDKSYNERPQSAMVVMDYKTGSVVGLVGGAGDKVQRGLNRATSSKRQPGSTIKPIAVYAPGIDTKVLTAATVYDNILTSFGKYTPKNTSPYSGLTSVRVGIQDSINVVAVKALKDVGVDTSYNYLKKMGISTVVEADKSLPLALGGISSGIIPMEMCGAYSTIANGGVYIEPTLYTKVVDKKGNTLVENKPEKRQVFSEQTAYIMIDMMRDVVRSGTATYINIGGNPVAAKTGTTDDDKDRWFCGITPYYAGSVWFGFDDPKEVNVSGQNPAARIWNAVMKDVHSDLKVGSFSKPSGVVSASICKDSGKLAGELCSQDQRGSRVRSELFISGTVPGKTCDIHVSKEICKESGLLASEHCPADCRETRVFIQRTVRQSNVSSAGDYIYEAPTSICTLHNSQTPVVQDPNASQDPNGSQDPNEGGNTSDKPSTGDIPDLDLPNNMWE